MIYASELVKKRTQALLQLFSVKKSLSKFSILKKKSTFLIKLRGHHPLSVRYLGLE